MSRSFREHYAAVSVADAQSPQVQDLTATYDQAKRTARNFKIGGALVTLLAGCNAWSRLHNGIGTGLDEAADISAIANVPVALTAAVVFARVRSHRAKNALDALSAERCRATENSPDDLPS